MIRKKYLKGILSVLLSVTMCSSTVLPSFAAIKERISYDKEGFTIEKVSHPTRGEGEIDGILTGEDEDRGQSYSWSMIEYGDYIYIGTCYNSIYGIYYRNLVTNLTSIVGAEKASEIAKAAIDLMYNGAFYQSTELNPAIMKVNKKTYEVEVVHRKEDASNRESGYRMAAEYNGKLYFASYGYPKSSLLEIDPENDDEVKNVYDVHLKDPSVANGIRGLVALDDKVIVSLTDIVDGKPGVKILSSTDPSSGEWTEIANQQTFNDLPAVYIKDGINGGGLFDIVEFNNSIYVTMVTAKTDENGVTDKRGFAMYRGDESGDSYNWTQIIGDKSTGAKYSFGLGVDEASAATIFVYDNHLYIGNYNDPMLDLAEIPNNGNFKPLYNDLYNSINLYRMDTNENIDLIGGMANEEFPVVKGNLGQGLGSVFNQYVWRYEEHNGKLYVGTYDTSTLTNGFTQLTNGDLLEMTPEEFAQKMKYLYALLESLKGIKSVEVEEEIKEESTYNVEEDDDVQEDIEDIENIEDTDSIDKDTESIDKIEDSQETIDADNQVQQINDENDINVESVETKDNNETEEESLLNSLSEEEVDMIENIGEENIDQLINDLENVIDKIDGDTARVASYSNGVEKTIVDDFNDLVAKYDSISKYLPNFIKNQINKILKNESIENFVYYLGINNYCKNAEKGFDLLVSSDGINFEAITRNGFNDKYNHGVRGFVSTEEGLFIGTANPFYGTQLWKLNESDEIVKPEQPEGGEVDKPEQPEDGEVDNPEQPEDGEDYEITYSVTIKYEIEGECDIKVPEATIVSGLKDGQSYDLTNEYTAIKEELLKAGCTVIEEPTCTGNISKDNVQLKAIFKAPKKYVSGGGLSDDSSGDTTDDSSNGNDSGNASSNESQHSYSYVKTGDYSNLILYSTAGLISVAMLFLVRKGVKVK